MADKYFTARDIARKIAKKNGLSVRAVEILIQDIADVINDELFNLKSVNITKLGQFKPTLRINKWEHKPYYKVYFNQNQVNKRKMRELTLSTLSPK